MDQTEVETNFVVAPRVEVTDTEQNNDYFTPRKILGQVQPCERMRGCEQANGLKPPSIPPRSSLVSGNHNVLSKTKSVVFDPEMPEKESFTGGAESSPQKHLRLNKKSTNSLKHTPKQLKHSNSKGQFDDCENDFTISPGKNSRRKSSAMRAHLLRDLDDDSYYGAHRNGDNQRHQIFESHTKKASSALRCLHDNETDGISSNAPRKSARYL